MGDEEFLAALEADNAVQPENAAETTEPTKEAPKEPEKAPEAKPEEKKEGPARDATGKFAPKQEEKPAEPVAETPPAPEPPKQPDPGFVPIAALLDEREKARAAAERAAQLERQMQEARSKPVEVPDMIADPEGYHAFINQQIEGRLYSERLTMSERIARIEHGAETFAKMKEWGVERCNADPFFNQKVRQSQDPYTVVAEEWKREQAASIPSDELEQFRQWKAAQAALSQQQPPASAGTPAPPAQIPPPSLASAPSAGNVLTEPVPTEEDIFAETFARK